MKLTRIRIRDFRSIEALDVAVPAAGLNIAGPNSIGKTNVARALKAALTGVGVAPDAIRDGADACEVLVDTDDPKLAHIRQTITQAGGSLTVRNGDGDKLARPRERLKELFGLSCFDPLAFYRATPAEQRRMVLATMPVAVTAEDLERWTGQSDLGTTPFDLSRNGLEVIAAVHKAYYDLRTQANKDAADAATEAKRAQDEAERLAALDKLPKGTIVPSVADEENDLRAARRAYEDLERQAMAAEQQAKRTAGTRERIAKLRGEQAEIEAAMGEPPAIAEHEQIAGAIDIKMDEISALKAKLASAEVEMEALRARSVDWQRRMEAYNKADELAGAKEAAAEQLEATLAETAVARPTDDQLRAALAAVSEEGRRLALVRDARAAHDASVKAASLADEAKAAQDEAARLDRIVRTLAVDAPTELAARANLIPGLTLTEDGVLYQGRPIDDSMSGAQRMLVAVQIAKRANAKAGLMMVDEIGILDDEHMREFVRLATAEGWQLISTCMRNTTGPDGKPTREMVLEAIELDDEDRPLNPARRVKVVKDGKEIA